MRPAARTTTRFATSTRGPPNPTAPGPPNRRLTGSRPTLDDRSSLRRPSTELTTTGPGMTRRPFSGPARTDSGCQPTREHALLGMTVTAGPGRPRPGRRQRLPPEGNRDQRLSTEPTTTRPGTRGRPSSGQKRLLIHNRASVPTRRTRAIRPILAMAQAGRLVTGLISLLSVRPLTARALPRAPAWRRKGPSPGCRSTRASIVRRHVRRMTSPRRTRQVAYRLAVTEVPAWPATREPRLRATPAMSRALVKTCRR